MGVTGSQEKFFREDPRWESEVAIGFEAGDGILAGSDN